MNTRNLAGAAWRKSTYSGSTDCVELAALDDGTIAVRDSKNPGSGALCFTRSELAAWIKGARAGEFDDLSS
jgi:hypothetical protein